MFKARRTSVVGALLVMASLTACSGGSDTANEPKVLKLWHYEGATSAMGIAWSKAIELFKTAHPGVEVQFEEKGFEQIRQNASMILNSDEAPDLMEYNKGNASAGLLAKQGLLTDLSGEAKSRGWDSKISPSLQTTAKYDDQGIMGGDRWYGVPNYGEYVMVFYNKDMFAKYNVAVPKTLAEFETALDTFTRAGITPIANAGSQYPAQQIFYELALSKADRNWVNSYELYTSKVDFHGPQLTYAATTFADWVKKGFVAKDSSGLTADDMGGAFISGRSPIMISGSWWAGRLISEAKSFGWGTFLFPGNKLHPGSSGNIWVVPTSAKAKTLAYDFINITMSPEVQNLLGNSGGIPVAADSAAITDPVSKELIGNFNTVSTQDGLAFYPDWPAPGYYDTLVAGCQDLMTGAKTPTEMLDAIAKPYNDNLADIGK